MFANALYYPYILIPDNIWLRRVILYWDRINPIVPWAIEQEIPQEHVSRQLEAAGALSFVRPEDYLDWRLGKELSNDFLKIVSAKKFQKRLGPKKSRSYTARIHRDKFANGLLTDLSSLGLYVESPSSDGWLVFERNTATIYMGLLASTLARHLSMEPLTDNNPYQRGFIESQFTPSDQSQVFLTLALQNVLPAPKEAVEVKQLLRFREKQQLELLAFKKVIREFLESLGSLDESIAATRKIEAFKDEIKEHSELLKRKLNESQMETTFAIFETMLSLDLPKITAILGASVISIPFGAALFGANACIRIGKALFEGSKRKHSILESDPYSYVFRVQKKFQ